MASAMTSDRTRKWNSPFSPKNSEPSSMAPFRLTSKFPLESRATLPLSVMIPKKSTSVLARNDHSLSLTSTWSRVSNLSTFRISTLPSTSSMKECAATPSRAVPVVFSCRVPAASM